MLAGMDWKTVISELVKLGYSQARIASECGCGQATVSDIYCGQTTDPKFTTGQALIELHKRVTRGSRRKARTA